MLKLVVLSAVMCFVQSTIEDYHELEQEVRNAVIQEFNKMDSTVTSCSQGQDSWCVCTTTHGIRAHLKNETETDLWISPKSNKLKFSIPEITVTLDGGHGSAASVGKKEEGQYCNNRVTAQVTMAMEVSCELDGADKLHCTKGYRRINNVEYQSTALFDVEITAEREKTPKQLVAQQVRKMCWLHAVAKAVESVSHHLAANWEALKHTGQKSSTKKHEHKSLDGAIVAFTKYATSRGCERNAEGLFTY